MDDCLFCKIIAGKIPSKKVYEDDKVYAFEDIDPKAPTHVLIVPKRHIVGLDKASLEDAEIIGYSQLVAAKLGRERGIARPSVVAGESAHAPPSERTKEWFLVWSSQLAAATLNTMRRKASARAPGPRANRSMMSKSCA